MTPLDVLNLAAALAVVGFAARYGLGPGLALALLQRDLPRARSVLAAARVRRQWPRVARSLGLVELDRSRVGLAYSTPDDVSRARARVRVPRLWTRCDGFGWAGVLRTVPGVGLAELEKDSAHLADAWRAVRVAAVQSRPGWVRLRVVRVDPLTIATVHVPDLADPGDLRTLPLGTDEWADPVSLRLDGVSGMTVAGVPGTGKTSLLLGLTARLAPSPACCLILLDGKTDDPRTEGDYAPVADRFSVVLGDDLAAAVELLERLVEFRRLRASSIRAVLGTSDVWQVGPSPQWPLIVLMVDECQTYLRLIKAGRASADRDALAARAIAALEDLIKKGRNVGILTILATQKVTGDSLPTALRDVCAVSLCFGVRSTDAAVAALGDDIRAHPDLSPVHLLRPDLRGCVVMVSQTRAGFLRLRTPWTAPEAAGRVAAATASLVAHPGELPPVPQLVSAVP